MRASTANSSAKASTTSHPVTDHGAIERYVARPHQPVGRQELGDVVEHTIAQRIPVAAHERQERDQSTGRGTDGVRGQEMPSRTPRAAKGKRATSINPVISSQVHSSSRTPSTTPDAYSSIMPISAMR